jgi:hypothetical protein
MPRIGDVIQTSDGKVLQMVPRTIDDGEITIGTLAKLLDQINVNLSILIDTERWVGKYNAITDQIDANTSVSEYKFNFPPRYIKINADQPIKVQINDIGNPVIDISAAEYPYVISDIKPGLAIRSLFVTTGSLLTNITILGMG